MTSLSLIGDNYCSSSEDDSAVLRLPSEFKEIEDKDTRDLHQGRVRSFKHERGNWATHIYIVYPQFLAEELLSFSTQVFEEFKDWKGFGELHLSLSRTVAVPFHFIEPIVRSLRANHSDFNLSFSTSDLRFYSNDEKTRTFLGFEITDYFAKQQILKLVARIDKVLAEYGCEGYYPNPSFHISVAWCLGGEKNCKLLDKVKRKFENIEEENSDLFRFKVDAFNLKSGNKLFQIKF